MVVKNLLDICQKMKRPRLEGRSKVQQQEDCAVKATDLPKNKSFFMALNLSVFICMVGVTAVLPKIGMPNPVMGHYKLYNKCDRTLGGKKLK